MHLRMDGTHSCGGIAGGHSPSCIVDGFVYNYTKRRNLQTHLFTRMMLANTLVYKEKFQTTFFTRFK